MSLTSFLPVSGHVSTPPPVAAGQRLGGDEEEEMDVTTGMGAWRPAEGDEHALGRGRALHADNSDNNDQPPQG
jgi:hypothetical protein